MIDFSADEGIYNVQNDKNALSLPHGRSTFGTVVRNRRLSFSSVMHRGCDPSCLILENARSCGYWHGRASAADQNFLQNAFPATVLAVFRHFFDTPTVLTILQHRTLARHE